MNRRLFLSGLGGLGGLLGCGALAAATLEQAAPAGLTKWRARPADPEARLLVVLLRGGLDGLAMLPPHGDPDYRGARGALALDGALDLDGFYGLHPALAGLWPMWERKELLPVHAVGLAYSGRSHFDAQDLLENGTAWPHGSASGWLNRLIGASPRPAIAFSDRIPLLLSGPTPVQAVDPGRDDLPDSGLLDRVAMLYEQDELLSVALMEARALAGQISGAAKGLTGEAAAIGRLLAGEARIGVVDYNGWDSHSRQGDESGGISRPLAQLGAGLAALPAAMGAAWQHTAVLVITEFGRTVAPNGTQGTDHGTGGAALLCGGAVAGGRVLADWPGLGRSERFEGRDLRTTLDSRALIAAILRDHLAVPEDLLYRDVLPGGDRLEVPAGLFRA